MPHGVLKQCDPMIGIDFHIVTPPPVGPPLPLTSPYLTFQLMFGLGITAKYAPDVLTETQMTMLKGTDIGPMIPHIGPPSLTMVLEMLFSSSKSYFTTASYTANGKPIVATLGVVSNPNLNCGTPFPTPTGMVLSMTTHRVNLTWADIFVGFGAMLSDVIIQSLLQWAGGKLEDFIVAQVQGRIIGFAMQQVVNGRSIKGIERLASAVGSITAFGRFTRIGVDDALGVFIGGPMGVDAGNLGMPTPGGWLGDTSQSAGESAGRAVGEYFDNPSIDEY